MAGRAAAEPWGEIEPAEAASELSSPAPARAASDSSVPSSSSGAASDPGARPASNDGFIHHRVSKLDTLAGLAIKYHVTVSDIKRANGILSDNAMFARELIKIPTGPVPLSEEAQVLFARLMSGYGRDASLNARERKAPGTASINQLPGSPGSHFGSEAVEDEPGTPYSRRSDKSGSEPGDVELMERSLADGAAYGYGSDRVRRRTKNDSRQQHQHGPSAGQQLSHAAEAAVGWLSNAAAAAQAVALPAAAAAASGLSQACLPSNMGRRSLHANSSSLFSGSGGSGGGPGHGPSSSDTGGSAWQALGSSIARGGSSFVDRIKRAASQPALAGLGGGGGGGFGDAADALLAGGPSSSRPPASARSPSLAARAREVDLSSIDLLQRGAGGLPPPRKDTKGD